MTVQGRGPACLSNESGHDLPQLRRQRRRRLRLEKCGILDSIVVADFATGDVLQLQGVVDVDWTAAHVEQGPLVERTWRFRIVRGWLRTAVFGLADSA
jgi:hypothetical protein